MLLFLCRGTFLFVLSVNLVNGFTVGVPPLRSVCSTMTPQHHDYPPQTSDSPYTISVNSNQISGGENVLVTLKSNDPTTKFIGFYVQARDENDSPIGTFTPINKDTKVHSCGGIKANGAHHANGGVKKDNVTISWTAPKLYQGEVIFTATALQNFVTYWVFLETEPVIIKKSERIETSSRRPLTLIPRPTLNIGNVNSIPRPNIIGNGIQMIFQNLQNVASRFGNALTGRRRPATPTTTLNTNTNANSGNISINGNIEISKRISNQNSDDSRASKCNSLFFKRIFCILFQSNYN